MFRALITVIVLLLGTSLATAEPLPWSYEIRFKAAGGHNTIVLGSDTWSGGVEGPDRLYYATIPTNGPGIRTTGTETFMGRTSLFGFGYGTWDLSETPPNPEATSLNAFDLIWSLTAPNGESASESERGSISAGGFFTSGTGNFSIVLDVTREVTLNGQRAAVRFAASNNESVSRIEMTVTELPPPAQVPEPATLALVGIGLAGVVAGRWRKT